MKVKSIHLKNFQKHEDLLLNLCDGVNVLFGSSDAGKSCIRRALEWVVQNESFDGVRKTGTKKTSVLIILDDGTEIERIRSQSINRYILREGDNEEVFDSIGKTIPDKIKEVLSIYPIEIDGEQIYLNSQPQIALPFLFDKSPSFRMKLFNKLTGNDVLDKLFGQFNKDILRIKRSLREETERFGLRAMILKRKKVEKEKTEAIHIRLKKRVENLKKLSEKYHKLLEIKELRENIITSKDEAVRGLNRIKIPQAVDIKQLKEKVERFEQLKNIKNGSEKLQAGLSKVRSQLKDFRLPELKYGALNSKIQRLDTLKSLKTGHKENSDTYYKLEKVLHDVELVLCDKIDEYKELLKEAKICPTCQ